MPPLPLLADLPAQWLSQSICTGQVAVPDAAALARLLLLAPVLEEWVVRAGLQEWLIRRGPGGGKHAAVGPVAWSAVAFGLLHLGSGWRAALLVAPPGLLVGLLVVRGAPLVA